MVRIQLHHRFLQNVANLTNLINSSNCRKSSQLFLRTVLKINSASNEMSDKVIYKKKVNAFTTAGPDFS